MGLRRVGGPSRCVNESCVLAPLVENPHAARAAMGASAAILSRVLSLMIVY